MIGGFEYCAEECACQQRCVCVCVKGQYKVRMLTVHACMLARFRRVCVGQWFYCFSNIMARSG